MGQGFICYDSASLLEQLTVLRYRNIRPRAEGELLQRMEDIQQLNETDKGHLFALMDAFLKQTKLQQILK